MRIYQGVWPLQPPPAPVVTVGNFDGVHLGHQAIFNQVRRRARELAGTSVVLTFHPHPRQYFKPHEPPFLLCSAEERLRLLHESGIGCLVIAAFDAALAGLEAEAFVDDILLGRLGARALFVGYDFNFGRNRRGHYEMLRRRCADRGVEVDLIEEVLYEGQTISSSRIRKLVQAGDLRKARELMGRSYRLIGPVVRGRALGARLGFPTANVGFSPDRLLPAFGVYAAWAIVDDRRWLAAVNIGVRPTVEAAQQPTVEAHLLDYDGAPLYGRQLELRFIDFLRPERKFDGVETLQHQIAQDIALLRARHGTVSR